MPHGLGSKAPIRRITPSTESASSVASRNRKEKVAPSAVGSRTVSNAAQLAASGATASHAVAARRA
ncbi:MAG: hypothetical protein JWO69_910 [Thermoleophilia bacterium]|nr:hypothetical protein [Thermoleophilia bacterium]